MKRGNKNIKLIFLAVALFLVSFILATNWDKITSTDFNQNKIFIMFGLFKQLFTK